MEKTYKREVAGGMLGALAALFVAGWWFPDVTATAEYLTMPIFLFATGAFGIDAVSKQMRR